jgi:hypothetical protein
MSAYNTGTCACTVQQYSPIIFDSVAYQNSANTVYQSKNSTVTSATNGTLGKQATGNPIFKSNAERMQYLLGRQTQGNNGAGCGVRKKAFALGTN